MLAPRAPWFCTLFDQLHYPGNVELPQRERGRLKPLKKLNDGRDSF